MHILLSYDLLETNGAHAVFKDQMMKKGWSFENESKKLPNTTCFKSFTGSPGTDSERSAAEETAERDVLEAERHLTANTRSKVERYVLVAFPSKWRTRL